MRAALGCQSLCLGSHASDAKGIAQHPSTAHTSHGPCPSLARTLQNGRQQPGASCSGHTSDHGPTAQLHCLLPTRRAGRRRARRVVAGAAGSMLPFGLFQGRQQLQDLWDYDGSSVRTMSPAHAQTLHRLSFGHRNQRTYVLVVYTPGNQAVVPDLEAKIEQLASGLRHESSVVVAKLDVTPKEAADFAYRILGITATPAVLLYPEAAPGCLRYAGTELDCEELLGAINAARLKAQPTTHLYELMDAYMPLGAPTLAAAPLQQQQQQRNQQQGQQRQQGMGGRGVVQTVASLQQLSPLTPGTRGGYWTPGRAAFWMLALAASVVFFAWDRWYEEKWAAWSLKRRQQERRQGRAFTAKENIDDLMELLLVSETYRKAAEEEEMAQKELGDGSRQ